MTDVQEVWNCLGLRKKYNQESSNLYTSEKEKEFNLKMKQATDKLNKDFIRFYQDTINKLSRSM